MTSYFNSFTKNTRFTLLPLILLFLHLGSAQAAPSPSFSASASGTTANLNLSITVNIADADVGMSGNYYVAFNFNSQWYFNTPQGWVYYTSGPLPAYAWGTLGSGTTTLGSKTQVPLENKGGLPRIP